MMREAWIGTFAEIQKGATIGARCKIQSHALGPAQEARRLAMAEVEQGLRLTS